MTLKTFRRVCCDTKVEYIIFHKNGTVETILVDYLSDYTENLIRILDLETMKNKVHSISAKSGLLTVLVDMK